MGKMKFVDEVVTQAGDCIAALSELVAMFESNEPETEEPQAEPEKTYSLEEVRAELADLSRAGFTNEVRELIKKYGASKLSEVDSSKFADLIRDARGISNV